MQFAAERSAQTKAMSRGANRLNDGSLVLAAKNEHSTAFATLSDQYKEQLFRAAHRITKTREDAEDAHDLRKKLAMQLRGIPELPRYL
jgi:hypothetical protein